MFDLLTCRRTGQLSLRQRSCYRQYKLYPHHHLVCLYAYQLILANVLFGNKRISLACFFHHRYFLHSSKSMILDLQLILQIFLLRVSCENYGSFGQWCIFCMCNVINNCAGRHHKFLGGWV